MSLGQASEESKTAADFFAELVGQRIEDIRWGPAYSAGTRIWVKLSGRWSAFLISDWTAPAKASSTHIHLGNAAGSGTANNVTTSSVTFVDIVTATMTIPTLPAATLFQILLLATVQASESVAADTYDLRIGDKTLSNFNSFAGFNNTDIVGHGLLTNLNLVSPSGTHTFAVQGQVNVGANTLTVTQALLAVYGWATKAPLSGS